MEQALYRKYRSRNFDEIVGQEHITETLKKALKGGKVAHAYLFTGPRGVGKTSAARILAHEVNQLAYNDDSLHLDIIEIDAASNRRIDEIRDLRERVHIAPTSLKYKVYIIDEVHMLTKEAFNALLKTLEEPPAHCIFILATTEVHKLPETIVSRTQRFSFKPVDNKTAAAHLKMIAKKERINIDDEALLLLAEHGRGSFRDSISMLDQLSASGTAITEDKVRQLLGLPSANSILKLLKHLAAGNSAKTLEILEQLWDQGASPVLVSAELTKLLRQRLIENSFDGWMISVLRDLISVSASPRPQDQLEIAILEAANREVSSVPEDSDLEFSSQKSSRTAPEVKRPQAQPPPKENSASDAVASSSKPIKSSEVGEPSSFTLEQWQVVIDDVKSARASLYTALRLAQPNLGNSTLTLAFQFPLHQRKVNQSPHRKLIEDMIEKKYGEKIKIVCIVDKTVSARSVTEIPVELMDNPPEHLQTINSIFGPAEMLES